MNHTRLGFLTPSGLLAAGLTVLVIVVIGVWQGGVIFNPGALNAQAGDPLSGATSHAGIGGLCSACHAPFWGPDWMADRCMDCHAEIAAQLADAQSLHNSLLNNGFPMNCWDCHPEHRGALERLSIFEPAYFPHLGFGFPLLGGHAEAACLSCHVGQDYIHTPADCASCHAKEDIHNGELGADCSTCHTPDGWKPSTFDHTTAIFQLTGKHIPVACADCHTDNRFKGVPTACAACHAKDDVHDGVLGAECSTCHTTDGWKPSTFDHTTAIFQLTGKHIPVACADCHTDKLFKGTPTDCASCHTKDDVHLGQLSSNCKECHTTAGWIPSTFDHNTTAFKLDGRHGAISCASCHSSKTFVGLPTGCNGCHANDDPHNARFGNDCGACHSTTAWRPASFDHNLSAFKLTGKHVNVSCESCHSNGILSGAPTSCGACHAGDDAHGGRFGSNCDACHSTSGWSPATFDHNLSGFLLTGAHAGLSCDRCHTGSVLSSPPTACEGCHAEPSYHAGVFGTNCGQCHNTSNWSASWSGPHPGGCDGNCINHENATCRDCHPSTLAAATCTSCHDSDNPGDGGDD